MRLRFPAALLAGCAALAVCGFLPLTPARPKVVPDELAYLGVARFLGGAASLPDFERHTFYQPTYGALISPAYWPGAAPPEAAYRRVQAMNALLVGLLPLLLWRFLRTVGVRRRLATGAALATGTYPAFLVQCRYAMPEVAFALLFVGMLLLFARLLRRPTPTAGAVFACAVLGVAALHPRGAPVALLAFGLIAVLVVRRRLAWRAGLAALAAMTIGWAGLALFERWILRLGWESDTRHSAVVLLEKLVDPPSWAPAARALLGQAWYLGASTYGLALLGAAFLWRVLSRPARRGSARARRRLLVLLLALGALGILAVSALHMIPGGPRQGHLAFADARIYGRYDEGFLAPVLALGMVSLVAAGGARRQVRAALLLLVFGLALRLAWGAAPLAGEVIPDNVLGLALVLGQSRFCLGLVAIALAGAVVAGGVAALRARPAWGAHAALAAVAGLFALAAGRGLLLTARAGALPTRIPELLTELRASELAYDRAALSPYFYLDYQSMLPTVRFLPYDSRRGETPAASFAIAATPPWAGARYVWSEAEQTLWARRGAVPAGSASFDARRTVVGVDPLVGVRREGFGPVRLTAEGAAADIGGTATLRIAGAAAPGGLQLALGSTFARPVEVVLRVGGQAPLRTALEPGGGLVTLGPSPVGDDATLVVEIAAPPAEGGQRVAFRWLALADDPAEIGPLPAEPPARGRILLAGGPPRPLGCDEVRVVTVELRNDGSGRWPGILAGGAVEAAWSRAGEAERTTRVAVPLNLSPGRSLDLNVPLAPRGLAAGRYTVTVRALAGDAALPGIVPLTLTVQVGEGWLLCGCG